MSYFSNITSDLTTTGKELVSVQIYTIITIAIIMPIAIPLGLIGNFFIIYILRNNRQMQTITNLYILNLAISDILVC